MTRVGILAALALAGCSPEDVDERAVAICAGALGRTPTASTVERTAPLTPSAFEALAGYPKLPRSSDPALNELDSETARLRHSILAEAGGDLRMLTATLSFADGGRPTKEVCAFRLIGRKLDDDERIAAAIKPDGGDDARETLARLQGRKPPARARGRYRCCLLPY